ncbi:MAG TPA: class I SAM-dependent methyltransferase [Burkholderiales bacterium]|nr:class I SAM-dependent methyltransferase [Burkholderiales bacterium]
MIALLPSCGHWLAPVVTAFAIGVAGCDQQTTPAATRPPDVPYDPTPYHIVAEMLKLGRVGQNDVVYDLGCGDGRIVIAAARLGARGVCVDIDPQRIRESRANAARAGVAERIRFLNQDLFQTEIGEATVVTLFLWPSVNEKLRPKLWRELKPGARVVSYIHSMGDWRPQEAVNVESARGPRKMFLWIIPEGTGHQTRGAQQRVARHRHGGQARRRQEHHDARAEAIDRAREVACPMLTRLAGLLSLAAVTAFPAFAQRPHRGRSGSVRPGCGRYARLDQLWSTLRK